MFYTVYGFAEYGFAEYGFAEYGFAEYGFAEYGFADLPKKDRADANAFTVVIIWRHIVSSV
ncbi:hypothetical protein ACTXIZ_09045 [Psychrobacter celer]|uniref:hypothetical protein n=1 Tax=Psychrobacter celer TaxID=306572 RepID=UPI003FD3FE23